MSAPSPVKSRNPAPAKRTEIIRFRVDPDLKKRVARIAAQRGVSPSEFLRLKLWELTETIK